VPRRRFALLLVSDVNRNLGPKTKAKDRGHKAKAKDSIQWYKRKSKLPFISDVNKYLGPKVKAKAKDNITVISAC